MTLSTLDMLSIFIPGKHIDRIYTILKVTLPYIGFEQHLKVIFPTVRAITMLYQ
jgi:hypothetical protein